MEVSREQLPDVLLALHAGTSAIGAGKLHDVVLARHDMENLISYMLKEETLDALHGRPIPLGTTFRIEGKDAFYIDYLAGRPLKVGWREGHFYAHSGDPFRLYDRDAGAGKGAQVVRDVLVTRKS